MVVIVMVVVMVVVVVVMVCSGLPWSCRFGWVWLGFLLVGFC